MSIRFGTDGIRGRAGFEVCTAEVALAVGRAATRLAESILADRTGSAGDVPRVLVGRDTRPSGPMLERAVAAGVAAQGGEALLAEVLPTAGVMANLAAGLADVGVMITASHNPAHDNGFKVLGAHGAKLTDEQSREVEAWIAEPPAETVPGTVHAKPLAAFRGYTRALGDAAPDGAPLVGRRIAVDLAHGAATRTVKWLEDHYPSVDWVFVGTGEGTINDGVGSEHPEHLAEVVRERRCIGGFAVDGDADRCVLVDETGIPVNGDRLAWLLATGLGVRAMAVTVMSTSALEAALPEVHVVRTPVGDRHLARAMQQGGLPFGAEESGHVLFADGLPGGDGVLTGLRALCAALSRAPTISQALAPFVPFPRVKTTVAVRHRPDLDSLLPLQDAAGRGERRLGHGGRVFLRYSGTEPVLRVLVEGPDGTMVQAVADEVVATAREVLS